MPLKWNSQTAQSQSPLVSLTPEPPKFVLAAPGSITPRHRLTQALAAGSLLAVALRPMPRSQTPRALATTFTVTTLNPSGPGSLWQAVQDANANPGPDTITFQPGLTGTIALTGTLFITDSVQIKGPGPGLLSVSGGIANRIFYLGNPTSFPLTATISGLTIRDGLSSSGGAGILASNFDLTLDQVDLINNSIGGTASGGGLDFNSSMTVGLTIRNSLLSGNSANQGGGIYLYGANAVVITNTQIVSNTAIGEGGGAYLRVPNHLLIEDSTIMSNTAGSKANGGGINLRNGGGTSTIIRRTTITGNTALGGGGGAFFYNPVNFLIEDSTFAGNKAKFGGGIDVNGAGGTSNTIRRTTISGNTAGKGGGVGLKYISARLSIENSTVSGNQATGRGGGVYVYDPSRVIIQNSTIFSNSAAMGGGIQVRTNFAAITDSIIAGNVAPLGPDISGTFKLRYDLVQITGTAAITDAGGNLFGLDPLLGPLANNGGPTQTHLPAANSPARNAGDPAFAPPPATDQRGGPRVVDGRVDIGSVESRVELFLPLIRR